MSTSARILQLLCLLQHHRCWAARELAERLEVSERTVRRDVDRLRELGYPVTAGRGTGGGYQLAAGASLPPLVLDDSEAVAIAVGLGAAAHSPASGVAGVAEASVRALATVTQVLPARLRSQVEALRAAMPATPPGGTSGATTQPAVDVDVLTTVAVAARDGERLTLRYTARTGEVTQRTVEPHHLVPYGRRWYLVAYDLTRADWRTLRLDRVSRLDDGAGRTGGVARTGQRFRRREVPGGDAEAFVRAGLREAVGRHAVDVVVAAPPAQVARVGAWASVEPHPEGCRLTCAVDDLAWPALVLGAAGAPFRVVSPPELRDLLAEWAQRFGAAATTSPTTASTADATASGTDRFAM